MTWIAITTALVLTAVLAWIRRGHGGRLGRHIRYSDWLAWRDAMDDKERELEQLRKAEPKR